MYIERFTKFYYNKKSKKVDEKIENLRKNTIVNLDKLFLSYYNVNRD